MVCTECGECSTDAVFSDTNNYVIDTPPHSRYWQPEYCQLVKGTLTRKIRNIKKSTSRWTRVRNTYFNVRELTDPTKKLLEATAFQIYQRVLEKGKRLGFMDCMEIAEFILNPQKDLNVRLLSYVSVIGFGDRVHRSRMVYKKRVLYRLYQSRWNPVLYQKSVKMVSKGINPEYAFLYFHLDTVSDAQKRHQIKRMVQRRCPEVLQ
jgi:hypothetical protein